MRYHEKAPALVPPCREVALGLLSAPCFARDGEQWWRGGNGMECSGPHRTGSSACRGWSGATSLISAGGIMNLPFHLRVRVAVPAVGQVRLESVGWAQLKSQPGSSLPYVCAKSNCVSLCDAKHPILSSNSTVQHMHSLHPPAVPRCRPAPTCCDSRQAHRSMWGYP